MYRRCAGERHHYAVHDRLGVVPDFRNKKEITQHLLNFAEHSLAFSACLSAPLRWCGTGWQAPFYRAVFLFVVRSGQQPEIYEGATVRSLAIIGIAAFVSGMFPAGWQKPSLSRHILSVTIQVAKTAEWLAFGGAENGAYSDVCVAVMLLLSAWGLFDFWNCCKTARGRKP